MFKKKEKKKKPETAGEQVVSFFKTLISALVIVMFINGIAIASFVVPTGSMENTVMTGDFLIVNKFIYGPSTPQVIPFVNAPLPFFKLPGFKDPEPGDVIVFIFPGERHEVESARFDYYLKRCVAGPGDDLELKDNVIYVNGKKLDLPEDAKFDEFEPVRPANTYPMGKYWTRKDYGPLHIPEEGDVIELNMSNYWQWEMFIRREGHEISKTSQKVYIDNQEVTSYTVERDYCFGIGDNRDHSYDSRYWGFIPVENVVGEPLFIYWSWDTNSPFSEIGEKLSSIRWSRIFNFID